jgi:GntR family transcriptional regulator, transcriptional repressor for pyruvate dehydrogenase complex
VTSGARLSDQVAQQLAEQIHAGCLEPGEKLPPEARLVEQFQVSRTVLREAVSRLKSLGLVASRQGSGVYVSASPPYAPLNFDARHSESREAVVQMAEVRRALEAEAAGLAAQRRSAADVKRLKQAVQALDRAVKAGGDGVEQDLQFHRAIAEASHNPFLIGTLDYLAQFMRGAIGVTRANEARRADFAAQVREEHAAMVLAIEAADVAKARSAASRHMNNAIRRIESADSAFWRQQGERLAVPLVGTR